jgi:damage-control phosphatase, subfamily I
MTNDCTFCSVKSIQKLFGQLTVNDDVARIIIKKSLRILSNSSREAMPVEVARQIQAMIRNQLGNPDPYKEIKQKSNEDLLVRYGEFKKTIANAENSFETALRLAIAGNIIDYGAAHDSFDVDKTINHVLHAEFGINHSEMLQQNLEKAKTVLYLGDNAGEIVMDKLFIEHLQHPNLFFAVKGGPVLNDVTMEDAINVGMDKVANLISNGYDAPSTLLHKTSPEFGQLFQEADVVISKGQGNFEGLIETEKENLFFGLMVKCQYIGSVLGVNEGDFVLKKA